jgi:hypothetical protein
MAKLILYIIPSRSGEVPVRPNTICHHAHSGERAEPKAKPDTRCGDSVTRASPRHRHVPRRALSLIGARFSLPWHEATREGNEPAPACMAEEGASRNRKRNAVTSRTQGRGSDQQIQSTCRNINSFAASESIASPFKILLQGSGWIPLSTK